MESPKTTYRVVWCWDDILKIEKLIYGGEGLSRVDGEVVLTPFVLPGEVVEAERTGSRKNAQRARLVNVTEA